MSENSVNKEALFNEVKGSLFEYLMARRLSCLANRELEFLESLDKNYLNVLSQQDRMVRQFYPEMLLFLNQVSEMSANHLVEYLGEVPLLPQLRGKFETIHEADLILTSSKGEIPLSLKLNKKNSAVNTKSGGIKSFFTHYFSFLSTEVQDEFNRVVDQEYTRMAHELHSFNDMNYPGHFNLWVSHGKSELPGELEAPERSILRSFYARIATKIHDILVEAQNKYPNDFNSSLPTLMGFSNSDILQLICFHDFKTGGTGSVTIHPYSEVQEVLNSAVIKAFNQTSSVEITLGDLSLQIRVKPMNKFTTTAIKINCSVRFKPGAES